MKYFIKDIERDIKYMGMKYKDAIESFKKIDLPEFWNEFTYKLYDSGAKKLTDKKEAIGYIKVNDKGNSYEYLAAGEVSEFEDIEGFFDIVIPKGEYLFYEMKFKNKKIDLDNILKKEIPEISKEMKVNPKFAFEFYSEEFDFKDDETIVYLAVQIL